MSRKQHVRPALAAAGRGLSCQGGDLGGGLSFRRDSCCEELLPLLRWQDLGMEAVPTAARRQELTLCRAGLEHAAWTGRRM